MKKLIIAVLSLIVVISATLSIHNYFIGRSGFIVTFVVEKYIDEHKKDTKDIYIEDLNIHINEHGDITKKPTDYDKYSLYLEGVLGGCTLLMGGLGLWLNYKKK